MLHVIQSVSAHCTKAGEKDGSVWFASEMKCLIGECERIIAFPPGHFVSSREYCFFGKQTIPYYQPIWYQPDLFPKSQLITNG